MNIQDKLFDILLDNEDTFQTVDELYHIFKEKKYIYNKDNQVMTYWDFLEVCYGLEEFYNNVYSYYLVEDDRCRLVMIFSKRPEKDLWEELHKATFKTELVNEYDIFGNKLWKKRYMDKIAIDNNKKVDVYKTDLSLSEINSLIEFYRSVGDIDRELEMCYTKIDTLEKIIQSNNVVYDNNLITSKKKNLSLKMICEGIGMLILSYIFFLLFQTVHTR